MREILTVIAACLCDLAGSPELQWHPVHPQPKLLPGVGLRAKPNKINVYGKGGFFKAHRE